MFLLCRGSRFREGQGAVAFGFFENDGRQVVILDHIGSGKGRSSFHDIFKLSDIPRVIVLHESIQSVL